jgi:hypothetical protein
VKKERYIFGVALGPKAVPMLPQAFQAIFVAGYGTGCGNIPFGPKSGADFEYIYFCHEISDRFCGTNDLMINRIFRFSPNIFIFSRRHLAQVAQNHHLSPSIGGIIRGDHAAGLQPQDLQGSRLLRPQNVVSDQNWEKVRKYRYEQHRGTVVSS